VTEGDLVAATHGRSFWVLDNLSAIRQMTPEIQQKSAHLFHTRDPYRVSWGGGFGEGRSAHPVGQNPPSGAVVQYWLKQPANEVVLEFLDPRGQLVRRFTSKQDSATAADSLRADSVAKARSAAAQGGPRRVDSLAPAGLTPDSIKKLERRTGEETAQPG
jgi:hypothetical protein